MILSLSGLCLDNLPVGLVRRTTINGAGAKALVDPALAAGSLIGVYEFGPVPNERKDRTFAQIVAALRSVHGIEIDTDIFFSVIDDETDEDRQSVGPMRFGNPPNIYNASVARPILIVTYFFANSGRGLLDMDVSEDSLRFDLIEVMAA